MPERIRSIATRLRELVGNRRRDPRFAARLRVAVTLLDDRGRPLTEPLEGYTRDLSASGLGLVLPAVRVGGRYLAAVGQMLEISLSLPANTLRLRGTPVRYVQLEERDAPDIGYLVGLMLTGVEDRDRQSLAEYVRSNLR